MHNHGTGTSSSDELQELESITWVKAEFLKQLLGDTEIERSETFDQSITVIWARRSLDLRLAFTDNHDLIIIHSIQSRKKRRNIKEMI
jgi:hypothetical protein